MEKSRKRSRHHFEKDDSPINERKRCVVWEDHRSSLDDLFFRDCDLIKRFVQFFKSTFSSSSTLALYLLRHLCHWNTLFYSGEVKITKTSGSFLSVMRLSTRGTWKSIVEVCYMRQCIKPTKYIFDKLGVQNEIPTF